MAGETAYVKFTTPKKATIEMKGVACPGWWMDYMTNRLDSLEPKCDAVWKLDRKEVTKSEVMTACFSGYPYTKCEFCGGEGRKHWKHRESPHHSSGSVTTCPECRGMGHILMERDQP